MYESHEDLAGSEFLPLIDVLLVMLVLFMGVTVGLGEITPPSSPKPGPGGSHAAVVEVFPDGRLRLNERDATPEEIARLWSDPSQKPDAVQIRGDQDTAFKHYRRALALCRTAGIEKVAEAAREE